MSHPLDRAAWTALTTHQAGLAERAGQAVRLRPEIGLFAATRDAAPESLADLAALPYGPEGLWFLQPEEAPATPGFVVARARAGVQMVQQIEAPVAGDVGPAALGPADAAEMLALAELTQPGPFRAETYRMGSFIGVRREGRLVAMAGERLRLPGFTEVSGVCTHPEHRGQGLARALMLTVMAGIRARGDVPFLHAYADNAGAIALYRKLGFTLRSEVVMSVLVRA